MKTNAIVRIILFSIAIIVLTGILLTGLGIGLFMVDTDGHDLPVTMDGTTNTGAVDASEVRNIEIEWLAGPIVIRPIANTNQITITETAPENEKYHMVYRKNCDTLEIQFAEESATFNFTNTVSKELTITVPTNWICNSLEIDAASAGVQVYDITIDDVSFDGASGVCHFNNCNVGDLDVDTASGNVNFIGTLNRLDCETASGSCYVKVSNVPDSISIDAASGDLDLYLPEECGFTAEVDTISGKFASDFTTKTLNGYHVHGTGSCEITVSAASGNISIHKHNETDTQATTPYCTDPACTDESHDHSEICAEQDCTEDSHGHSSGHHN